MSKKTNGELPPSQELATQFKDLDDDKVAHSIITGELFCSGADGEDEVNQRIEKITMEAVKDDAKFRIAKLYYESKHDIDSALKKVEGISNPAEQARCLVQLAIAILQNEGNEALADEIFAKAEAKEGSLDEIQQSYLKIYPKEKAKILTK